MHTQKQADQYSHPVDSRSRGPDGAREEASVATANSITQFTRLFSLNSLVDDLKSATGDD